MLRFLITLGTVYAAFKLGRNIGRDESLVLISAPVDYERRPSMRNYEEIR
ncbi:MULTISPECIES: hypothetical protein [unclassified Mesorhizobium]|nr:MULTISPECIES: hypothetical protein [unclassified Mesorhizobium]